MWHTAHVTEIGSMTTEEVGKVDIDTNLRDRAESFFGYTLCDVCKMQVWRHWPHSTSHKPTNEWVEKQYEELLAEYVTKRIVGTPKAKSSGETMWWYNIPQYGSVNVQYSGPIVAPRYAPGTGTGESIETPHTPIHLVVPGIPTSKEALSLLSAGGRELWSRIRAVSKRLLGRTSGLRRTFLFDSAASLTTDTEYVSLSDDIRIHCNVRTGIEVPVLTNHPTGPASVRGVRLPLTLPRCTETTLTSAGVLDAQPGPELSSWRVDLRCAGVGQTAGRSPEHAQQPQISTELPEDLKRLDSGLYVVQPENTPETVEAPVQWWWQSHGLSPRVIGTLHEVQ